MLPYVLTCDSQTAILATHKPKASYHKTEDKLVVATILQNLHSTLKKDTYRSTQRDTEWSVYVLLAPIRTPLTR